MESNAKINPALAELRRPIADLTPDPRNARRHGRASLEAIESSLSQFGQQKPIVVDKGGKVLAGNGLLRAATKLGWDEVAAVEFKGSEEELMAYALADNRSAELSTWNLEILDAQVSALGASFDFGPLKLEKLIGANWKTLETPSAPPKPPTEEEEEDGEEEVGPGQEVFELVVTEADAEFVNAAIEAARQKGAMTSGEAWIWICREYLGEQEAN